MKLPFTTQQFLDVFRKYNETVFPLQALFFLLAAVVVFLTVRKASAAGKAVFFTLAAFWLWMGTVYHIAFFSTINKAAFGFGALSVLEGVSLLCFGFANTQRFSFRKDVYGFAGSVLMFYALAVYPVIGHFSGHAYPYAPTFGLPCPTTIFTFGILLFSKHRLPFAVVAVPVVWSVIGFSAAFTLSIYEDTALIVSGLLFAGLNRKKEKMRSAADTRTKKISTSALRPNDL